MQGCKKADNKGCFKISSLCRMLCFLLIILLPQVSAGQLPEIFKHLTVENGLSSGSVLSITQDKSGFIWMGTMDGLNRYDGNKIKVFKSFYKDNIIEQNIQINNLLADDEQNIWIGTNNGLYVYNTRQDTFKVFFHQGQRNKKSLTNNNIKAICLDRHGNIWVGTEMGLNKIIADKEGHYQFVSFAGDFGLRNIQALFEDSYGNMLAGTTTGLYVITVEKGNGMRYSGLVEALVDIDVSAITEDMDKQLWIGTNKAGLFKYTALSGSLQHFTHKQGGGPGLISNTIGKMAVDKKGQLWISTLKGLNVYTPADGKFRSFFHDPANPRSLSNNVVFDMFVDRQGSVWIATFFGGVNIVEALTTPFAVYRNDEKSNSISSNIASAIAEDEHQNLWIGTEADGLNYFDTREKTFRRYTDQEAILASLGSNNVKAILRDRRNRIWIGLYNGGLALMQGKGRGFKHFRKEDRVNTLRSDNVTCLLEDSKGRIWIGQQGEGINIYSPERDKMETLETVFPHQKLNNNYVSCLFQDSKKNIWVGTKQGLNMIPYPGVTVKHFLKKAYPGQLTSDIINCIAEDRNGIIWIGTYSGLSCYDPAKKVFKSVKLADGPSGNKILGIVVDNSNNLWLSTEAGLTKLDPSRTKISNYNAHDGLPGNVFNYGAFYKTGNGDLLFGSYNGLVQFSPQSIQTNLEVPNVKLTALSITGKPVTAASKSGVLTADISETKDLELKHDQNVVTIDYAVLNFIKPGKSGSAYKLDGYNRDWVYTNIHQASFTNLPTGKYTLLIKACNNDGVWSKRQRMLGITVLPPPWLTWWAYLLYTVSALAILGGIIYFFNSRAVLLRNLRFEQVSNAKQRELHQMKMDFFTHVSHEFRTPLTMIMGPVEMLMNLIPPRSSNQKLLNSIKTNADRLLKLTNDLMDFRKADAGHAQLKITAGDVVSFAWSIFEKFAHNASGKGIRYGFSGPEEAISLYFDPNHIEIVLTNLLSNALKFTPDGGEVFMQIVKQGEAVEICIRDNGIGIPAKDQQKIFSNFYQVDAVGNKKTGSGIGLAFSKSLVELHHGKIYFHSAPDGKGGNTTCFCVQLLLGKGHFKESDIISGTEVLLLKHQYEGE